MRAGAIMAKDNSMTKRKNLKTLRMRTFLMGCVLAGTAIGMIGAKLREARYTWKTVTALQKAGGYVHSNVSQEYYISPFVDKDSWLGVLEWCWGRPDEIFVIGEKVNADRTVQQIAAFSHLRRLVLIGTNVSEEGLSCLADLPGLEELSVSGSPISERGLCQISKIPNLKRLDLSQALVTDEGIRWLARTPKLRNLYLNDVTLPGEGLAMLEKLCPLVKVHGLRPMLPPTELHADMADLRSGDEISIL